MHLGCQAGELGGHPGGVEAQVEQVLLGGDRQRQLAQPLGEVVEQVGRQRQVDAVLDVVDPLLEVGEASLELCPASPMAHAAHLRSVAMVVVDPGWPPSKPLL